MIANRDYVDSKCPLSRLPYELLPLYFVNHKALIKNGVLSKDSERVDTTKIGKKFVSQLYMTTSHAQKKLIHLLFFWEEEIMRWKVLLGEKGELKAIIQMEKDIGGNVGTYEKKMTEIDMLLRPKPSIRNQAMQEVTTLPEYDAAAASRQRAGAQKGCRYSVNNL